MARTGTPVAAALRRSGWRSAGSLAICALLGACASLHRPQLPAEGDALSGRMSVQVEASATEPGRSVSASFDLQGSAERGQLSLSSPLGTTLAQAHWSPGKVSLKTRDGERRFDDLDAMSRDMLGEALPVGALFDWLRGRPWPQAPSRPLAPPQPAGFVQLGWTVDTSQLADGRLQAERQQSPRVTVRARIEP